ncbi:ankyrin repeat-containing protein [Ilyonectria sp. MPI-CAGE-AT-0026]|nr:ankyrin repeat-containing protein [Ilyonectria sp. MPI-CAGE-AT-0026]
MAPPPNPYLLAADNNPALLPLLRENPALAAMQDEHGYSLVHAAASYNHLDLLRALVREFHVDVDLRDEDDETALFVVETEAAAQALVEELGANINHRGAEGLTAREKIEAEGDFPVIAAYLAKIEAKKVDNLDATAAAIFTEEIPPPPEGMPVTIGTMDEVQDFLGEADPEFRRRIEELAQRDDFNTSQGQADLRKLVEEALTGQGLGDERSVRSKQE